MKKQGTRLLSGLMAAVMTFCTIPAGAVTAQDVVVGNETVLEQAVQTVLTETQNESELSVQAEIDMSDPTTWPSSGAFGEFTWGLDSTDSGNYVLTIRGAGDLPDWGKYDQKPWYPWRVDTIRLSGNITAIGDYNFNFGFKRINLPGTLKRIGNYAMAQSVMQSVSIPYGVTEIGDGAFNGADLEWVDIPDTVKTIGKYAFASTKLRNVVLPDSVTSLGEGAFQASELRTFVLPEAMSSIPDYCFSGVGELTQWKIPAQITNIGAYAFRNTGLKELLIPETVTQLGESAFEGSALETVTVAATLSELPKNCFKDCTNLDWVEIQSPVTGIPEGTFYRCTALRGVILPETVENVHNTGFYQNKNLLGVFARGSGVSSNTGLNTAFWSGIAANAVPTVYHLEGQTGWAGLEGEGCSNSQWYGHPLAFWDGINAELPDTTVEDYYGTPVNKFFCIEVPGAYMPRPTGFQIQVGGNVYNTGNRNRITIPVPSDYEGKIIFSKEGYLTFEMPAELAGSFNWVTMWPDDGGTTPVVQAIYVDKSGGKYKGFANLKTTDYTAYEMDKASRRFYVSVLWRDGEEGTISLVQNGKEVVQLENNAWTTFQPGMKFSVAGKGIYLKAENSKNKVSTFLKLNIRTPKQTLDVPFGPSLSGKTGTACEAMQDEKLELKINGGMLPVTLKVEDNKVIGVIGFSVQADKAEAAFNEAKELVDKADAGMGENIFEQFANLYGGMTGKKDLWPKRQSSMVVESGIQFLGYFEAALEVDENGEIDLNFGMSKLAMKLEGKATYTQQTIVIGIPMYWQLELAAMLEMAFQLYQESGLGEATLPELNMETELSLAGTLAVGIVDVVSAGVKAKGAFVAKTKLPIDPERMTLKLAGEISAFVSVVGLTGEKRLLNGEYIFYEDGVWYPDERLRSNSLQILEENLDFTKVSRDYLESGTAFVANEEPKLRAIVPESGSVTTKQIMANNYPYADPQLMTLPDGSQVLVWLEDDGTDNQGTELRFSCFDGRNWTQPAAVESDGTSDFEPELKLVDDTLYLLWLDAEQPIPSDCTDVSKISGLLDVSMAVFEAETAAFRKTATFGKSGVMDIMPDVTVCQQQPVVVWASSEDSLLSVEACDLWLACEQEDGWQQSEICSNLADMDSLCADNMQGALSISFSQSAGDVLAPEEKEIFTLRYLYGDGKFVQLGDLIQRTDNDQIDTAPGYFGGLLYWYQQDKLVNTAGQSLNVSSGRYQIIDDGDGRYAVIYTVIDSDEAVDFYVVMDDGSGWGEPVLAASGSGWIESWSAAFNSRGRLTIAASERDGESSNLSVYTITPKKDLAVSGAYCDGYTLVPGQELTVFVQVENLGMTEVSSYFLTGKFDGGYSAGSYSGGTLRPGEKETVCLTCTVPQSGAAELTVSLGSDTNSGNNTATIQLARQDLSVERVNLVLTPDGLGEATVSVINRGAANSGTAALVLKRVIPGRSASEPTQWEVLSQPMDIGALAPQTMMEYTLALTAPVEQGDMVYAMLEIPDADNLGENDSDFTVAALPEAEGLYFENSGIVSVSGGKFVVQVAADNRSSLTVQGSVCVAAYDAGKMMDVEVLTLSAAPGEALLEQIELDCPENGEIRMFVLTPGALCPMREMTMLEKL